MSTATSLHATARAEVRRERIAAAVASYVSAWYELTPDELRSPLAVRIATELAYLHLYDLRDAPAASQWADRLAGCVHSQIDAARLGLLRARIAVGRGNPADARRHLAGPALLQRG
jgi:hypothetical protein